MVRTDTGLRAGYGAGEAANIRLATRPFRGTGGRGVQEELVELGIRQTLGFCDTMMRAGEQGRRRKSEQRELDHLSEHGEW